MMSSEQGSWSMCLDCQGHGKKRSKVRKKLRLDYQKALEDFEKSDGVGEAPVRPRGHLNACASCGGAGLIRASSPPLADKDCYPQVAIIGGGMGGVALAVACLHRGIPFTLYERDQNFDARSQGYGLTLQQASKAMKGFGISSLAAGMVSTRHVVHTTDGNVIGEWGARKWISDAKKRSAKHRNVHIPRQCLRLALLDQLGESKGVQWGHQLIDLKSGEEDVALTFQVGEELKTAKADLVVGADGLRSSVRRLVIGEDASPLRYLGCMVILGICPLSRLGGLAHALLDAATVFQTANGNERIYMMPFSSDAVMWQLSFPMSEAEAKRLSGEGAKALKEEACRITPWHDPIPQIVAATEEALISGYPVYDRALLDPDLLATGMPVTLLGDAAHPMSPFKGQGANQALLDALSLARGITKGCKSCPKWRELGIRAQVLSEFESEMIDRSASKVKGSAEAAQFLHSEEMLHAGNETRGRCRQRQDFS